ncbi:MAG: UDP-N-acetylmuramate dehydrogenase [Spirochaetia bacterium]|nr:UDP-N-acetylmuramate dehydrogenase [Spirochaetia bacterium]
MNEDQSGLLAELCRENNIRYFTGYSLSRFTTFRTGGAASVFILPDLVEKSLLLQKFITHHQINSLILGGGSNILVSDKGFDGAIIKLEYPEKIDILDKHGNTLIFRVSANARSAHIAKKICDLGYAGLEFLTTIPGTIGGAIVQNAGCYGSEIKDFIRSVEISRQGKMQKISSGDLNFSYRHSIFKEDTGCFIHSGIFMVQKGEKPEIQNKVNTYKNNRILSQPKNKKNAGSIFRNPPNQKAWQLVRDSGLSGKQTGMAQISSDHCNFIINLGGASSSDIYQLIKTAQKTVYEQFQILLEPEIVFVGTF